MERVVEANPELRSVLLEHLDFAEEMLPHLLIGDVLRTTVGWYGAGRKAAVAGVLAALEAEYGVDYEVDELIAVSFVEDLAYSDEPGHGLVDELGPGLRAEYERQRRGRDGAY